MKKLKPVVFVQGDREFYRENKYAQTILLKAMSDGITDPKELMRVAGLQKVADVYRTLDKLSIRKEYHNALSRQGISLDKIVSGIKDICEGDSSDSVKLKGYQTLLKSLGLDKYEKDEEAAKGWEEIIIDINENKDKKAEILDGEFEKYKIDRPETPADELERQEKEKEVGKELYAD